MAVECCPVGYVYIDANGGYDDPAIGTGTVLNNPAPQLAPYLNKCAILVFTGAGYRATFEPVDPNECPCCRVGFTFSSFLGKCVSDVASTITEEPVPCLPCVCPDEPTPVSCESADRGLERSIDTVDGKVCEDCNVDDNYGPSGGIRCFIPQQDLDPIIAGFKLRNKNFM